MADNSMGGLNETLVKSFVYYKRGIISSTEFVNLFLSEIGYRGDDAVAAYCGLTAEQQVLVANYLERVKPEDLPPLLYIGDIGEEQIRLETAIRLANVRAIADYLSNS